VVLAFNNDLGADPAKFLVHSLGDYALWFLMLVILATPLRMIFRFHYLVRIRRSIGVAMFIYALLHLLAYITSYLGWKIEELLKDLSERPYIIVGMVAFLIALPLAITSNSYFVRILGVKWRGLHKFIYLMVLLVMVHIIWQVKVDYTEAILYSLYFVILMALRVKMLQNLLSVR
jgi:sulfoxide reductase heme-binding subunit YedZ